MAGRGRPPLDCKVVVVQLKMRLREGADDDLIHFFGAIPAESRQRASAVKAALRAGGVQAVIRADVSDDGELCDSAGSFLD